MAALRHAASRIKTESYTKFKTRTSKTSLARMIPEVIGLMARMGRTKFLTGQTSGFIPVVILYRRRPSLHKAFLIKTSLEERISEAAQKRSPAALHGVIGSNPCPQDRTYFWHVLLTKHGTILHLWILQK